VVEVVVSDLPAEKRLAKLTAEQEQALEARGKGTMKMTNEYGVTEDIDMWMGREIQKTMNEGLARRLVEEVQGGGAGAAWARGRLTLRLGSLRQPGIDGPYLKEWVLWEVGNLEKAKELTPAPVEAPMVYARLHPEDKAVMERLATVAKRFSKLPVANRTEATTWPIASEAGMTVGRAWRILQLTGALKKGMTVEEAREILGVPTHDDGTSMAWEIQWSMESGPPRVTARVKEGKVVEWSGSGFMQQD
jgi:hypothetical protein